MVALFWTLFFTPVFPFVIAGIASWIGAAQDRRAHKRYMRGL